jgi:NADH-quinone oxidoreductase subunit A
LFRKKNLGIAKKTFYNNAQLQCQLAKREEMLQEYMPILVFLIMAVLFGIGPIAAGFLLSPKKPDPAKLAAYECGFPAFEDARMPFDVRFYLVTILFIIFDLETAFLFPWAIAFRHLGWLGMGSMAAFLSVLVVGFVFEWKTGALEWE